MKVCYVSLLYVYLFCSFDITATGLYSENAAEYFLLYVSPEKVTTDAKCCSLEVILGSDERVRKYLPRTSRCLSYRKCEKHTELGAREGAPFRASSFCAPLSRARRADKAMTAMQAGKYQKAAAPLSFLVMLF